MVNVPTPGAVIERVAQARKQPWLLGLFVLGYLWVTIAYTMATLRGDYATLVPTIALWVGIYYVCRWTYKMLKIIWAHPDLLREIPRLMTNSALFLGALEKRDDPASQRLLEMFKLPPDRFRAEMDSWLNRT